MRVPYRQLSGFGVSTSTHRVGESFDFALPDTGAGGETRTAAELADSHDYVVAVLLRNHYCPLSRRLVQALAEAYEAFAGRSTAVVPVLPDTTGRASVWQRRYDLPFGLLTDPAAENDGKFGLFVPFQRLLPDLPGAVLFEADGDRLRFARTVRCDIREGGPPVEVLLEAVDDYAADGVVEATEIVPEVETAGDG